MENMGTPTPNSVPEALGEVRRDAGTKALEAGARPRGAVAGRVSHPASKLSRGDARPGDRRSLRGQGRRGGTEWRVAAQLREPLFIVPGARNSAEWSGPDDAGAAGADSPAPAPSFGPRMGAVEAPGPDPTPSRAPLLLKRPKFLSVTTVDGYRAKDRICSMRD